MASSFDSMPTLAAPTTTRSPSFHRRRKSWARKIERCCCTTFAYFPLVFVYGLTSWAVYVLVNVSFIGATYSDWAPYFRAGIGIILYTLANVSYTIAVFTDPGSPIDGSKGSGLRHGGSGRRGEYEGLLQYEDDDVEEAATVPREWMNGSVTAKSTGKPRYCKKCKSVKPDRAHHCSTCRKCVLKMDHHCPWLATCVGLRNYKAFILFLVYTSLFCWTDFLVSAFWVWQEFNDRVQTMQGMLVVNTILLSVLGGIIGLVLSAFTGWHIYLVLSGQTTIESLEKTRYLSPLKKSMENQLNDPNRRNLAAEGSISGRASPNNQSMTDRLKEIHANALPGVLRPEEGDGSLHNSRNPSPVPPSAAAGSSPAHQSLQRSYASMEAQREQERYQNYLDEVDSEKLPNAFDLGWKRNVVHVMGPNPKYWFLPICNTTGDGWQWETSPKFHEAKDRIARDREQRMREQAYWNSQAGHQTYMPSLPGSPPRKGLKWQPGQGFVNQAKNSAPPYMDGATTNSPPPGSSVQMQPLDRRRDGDVNYDTDDEEPRRPQQQIPGTMGSTSNWNDVPEEYLTPRNRHGSPARRKGDQKCLDPARRG
ncbi:hypothetical protein AC578_4048 [Pseudocercospora eumusae]|uniref:Palmitoyltransferase n=1 Tax=Pseudocercospora eumusae TaxID=321146 RepID=A0A139GXA4_9PEZI|nr:hypothetical protein AC578_4048 [Pseudocercospora eumusae]